MKEQGFVHKHLVGILIALMGLGGSAAGYVYLSDLDMVEKVSANTVGVARNKDADTRIESSLLEISRVVNETATKVAVIQEQVSSLKKP